MFISSQSQILKSYNYAVSFWNILASLLVFDILFFFFSGGLISSDLRIKLINLSPYVFSLGVITLFHDQILGYSSFISETRFKLISPGSYFLKSILLLFLVGIVGFEIFIKLGVSTSITTILISVIILFLSVRPIYKSAINYLTIQSEQAKIRLRHESVFENNYLFLSIGAITISRICVFLLALTGDFLTTLTAVAIFLMNRPSVNDFVEPCPTCIAPRSKVLTYFPGCGSCYTVKFLEPNQNEELELFHHKESRLKKRVSEFLKTRIPLPKGRKTEEQNAESSQQK